MEESGDRTEATRALNFKIPESAVVFRLAWYAVASKPGVLLNDYSEAESQIFNGKAAFSVRIDDSQATVNVWVEGAQKLVELTALGEDSSILEEYLAGIVSTIENSLKKYQSLSEDDKGKLKRALVAKTCWDRLVFYILKKAPLETVYFQLAHGREMMIKATEGEELMSLPLATSGWLSNIESMPRDEAMPGNVAAELAKKSIEWKKETQEVIARYL
ncbi:MAG: hypothetical protein ACFFD9_01330 [Candidatus Thorarchaeota archaeon]